MIRPSHDHPHVYLCRDVIDMRKSINGISILVEGVLSLDPFQPYLFVFCNRRRDKIKILYWEGNGFVLWYKRLEKQRFYWPGESEDEVVTVTGQQLNWLLDGYDLSRMKPHRRLHFSSVL